MPASVHNGTHVLDGLQTLVNPYSPVHDMFVVEDPYIENEIQLSIGSDYFVVIESHERIERTDASCPDTILDISNDDFLSWLTLTTVASNRLPSTKR